MVVLTLAIFLAESIDDSSRATMAIQHGAKQGDRINPFGVKCAERLISKISKNLMNGILRPKCVLFRQERTAEICGAVSVRSGDLIDLVIPGFNEIKWMTDKEKNDDRNRESLFKRWRNVDNKPAWAGVHRQNSSEEKTKKSEVDP